MGESLFTTTPAITDASDGAPGITTATTQQYSAVGIVSAIRFYATATVSGAYVVRLHEVTATDSGGGGGTLLGEKTLDAPPTAGAWNIIPLPAPVGVNPAKLYRPSLFSGAGRYVATLGVFTGVDLTSGHITAWRDGADPVGLGSIRNGTYAINASPAYAATPGNGTAYFVDVVYTEGTAVGASPQHATLTANVETELAFGEGYSRFRVTTVANPATIYFNAKDAPIGAVSGDMTGNDVLPAVLASFEGPIRMSGVAKVRLRSAGTPTVSVAVW